MLARLGDDCINVYESGSMKLLPDGAGKRTSVKVEGVRDFAWCPTENRIAYWVPELENAPVRAGAGGGGAPRLPSACRWRPHFPGSLPARSRRRPRLPTNPLIGTRPLPSSPSTNRRA